MIRITFVAALLASALLSACAAQQPPAGPPPAPGPAGTCNAASAQFAVGQLYGEALAEEVRRRSGATALRSIRPGQVVTLEYNSERINLHLDAGGRVTRVACG